MRVGLLLNQKFDELTLAVGRALTRSGVQVKTYSFPFLEALQSDRPDTTLAFNGPLADTSGHFLSDLISIPHVACLTHSAPWFVDFKDSSRIKIGCSDPSDVHFFLNLKNKNAFFLPPACDKNLRPSGHPKVYDVSLVASCIDIRAIEEGWRRDYSEKMVQVLHHAADVALMTEGCPYWQAFSEVLSAHRPKDAIDFPSLMLALESLELYLLGKSRIDLLTHISDRVIDVFGLGWEPYVKSLPHVRLHLPSDLEAIEKSRVLLSPRDPFATLSAFALGTLPVTSENEYLSQYYQDKKSILFYHPGSWKALRDKLTAALENAEHYSALMAAGLAITLESQTWDQRVPILLKEMSSR